jgi:hypothetical protein
MGAISRFWREHHRLLLVFAVILAAFAWLLLHKLGSLVGGMSANEINFANTAYGWHGIYHNPFFLPLKLIASAVFFLAPAHGQILTRVPSALLGGLTVGMFAWLIWLWHGPRTAFFSTVLFATGAWTLHVSRLASFDVVYLWALPALMVVQVLLHRQGQRAIVWYGSILTWGLLLYVPGLVWLVGFQLFQQRSVLVAAWAKIASWPRRALSIVATAAGLSLLILHLFRSGQFVAWLGLPSHWPSLAHQIKLFLAVPTHLFIRGPQYPETWLAKSPILDLFTLLVTGLGAYFYIKNWRASRSRSIGLQFIIGCLLVGLGGAVTLSLVVPMLYMAAAAGLAYLLHEWLKVFPRNPLARSLGIGLITVCVSLSCLYNLRAYFVAWPHHADTRAVFIYHR